MFADLSLPNFSLYKSYPLSLASVPVVWMLRFDHGVTTHPCLWVVGYVYAMQQTSD